MLALVCRCRSSWSRLSRYTGHNYTHGHDICRAIMTHMLPVHVSVLQLDETSNLVGTSRDKAALPGMFSLWYPSLRVAACLLYAPFRPCCCSLPLACCLHHCCITPQIPSSPPLPPLPVCREPQREPASACHSDHTPCLRNRFYTYP